MTNDDIFSKIVKGDIPAAKIYEDDVAIAFLDIMPANKGHALVIPKTKYETLIDMPEKVMAHLMFVAKKVAKAQTLSLGNQSYNLIMNNGQEAGQIVKYAHIHIIPRFKGDGQDINWKSGKYTGKELDEIKDKIKQFLEQ